MNLLVIVIFNPVCFHLSVKCTKIKSDNYLYIKLIKLQYEIENPFIMSGVTTVTYFYLLPLIIFVFCLCFDGILFRLLVPVMRVQQVAIVPYID
jgi:hypothetical protein